MGEIEQHIAAVEAFYRPLLTGDASRLDGGGKLWGQFTDAVATFLTRGRTACVGVYERVNELAVVHALVIDPTLAKSRIKYEPQIAANDRRIDFVVPDVERGSLYIEVKTVRPITDDNGNNWEKYEKRSEQHTENVNFIVNPEWRGAAIYGNSFSARSKFMEYTREFEPRLADASAVQPGRGLLVFCGTGMEWHRSELEDCVDFYHTGAHRQDDPFAKMESKDLSNGHTQLQRNIAAFGFMKRPMNSTVAAEWIPGVRGPWIFH